MKYRKRPVVIEARQLGESDQSDLDIMEWCNGFIPFPDALEGTDRQFAIKTLEGPLFASNGDFIIQGVQGEFYACKPDIFEQTYEPAEEEAGDDPTSDD